MGIKLKWDDQSDQNLDAIEIYRGTTTIDRNNPGTPLVTLPGNATEYEDLTVQNKNLYYYRIAGKKGTERGWGENKRTGYFSETGPGNPVPLRGDWDSGWMDRVSITDFISPQDLIAKMEGYTGSYYTGANYWHKLCYKGKVLFVPDYQVLSVSWNEAYASGILFGENGFGRVPAGVAGAVNQRRTVVINGLEYIVRLPRISDLPTDQYITTVEQTAGGEYREIFTRLLAASVDTYPTPKTKLFDWSALPGNPMGPHLQTAAAAASFANNQTAAIVGRTLATRIATFPVLELVMP